MVEIAVDTGENCFTLRARGKMWRMGVVILKFKNSLGDETTIEKGSTGRLELITEFERRFVTEAEVNRLARDAGVSHSMPPMVQGGLPSLGKRR